MIATRVNIPLLPRAGGFTLVEAAISIVIVGVMLTASLNVIGSIGRTRKGQFEQQQGAAMAEQLLSEIVRMSFNDPEGGAVTGADTGETGRAAYDDLDDYHGWTETDAVTLKDGTAVGTGYAGWTRKVRVDYVTTSNPKTVANAPTSLKTITVTVTAPSGAQFERRAVRSEWGAYEQKPTITMTYLAWAGIEVQIGKAAKPARSGAHPLNVTTSQ